MTRARIEGDRAARARVERALFSRLRRGDASARTELVDRFLPLAHHLARRYHGGGEPYDDLVQVASVGLLKAIDRFDPGRQVAFSTFAVPTMLGELKRHFRDRSWSIRVPRDLQELAIRVERAAGELGYPNAVSANVDEIARHVGATPEQVLEAREAAGAHRPVSLDVPARDGEHDDRSVAEVIGTVDGGYRRAEDRATLGRLMGGLSNREREVLRLRFDEDLTQSEIGARIGVSQMHVSRIIRQVIDRLGDAASAPQDHQRAA